MIRTLPLVALVGLAAACGERAPPLAQRAGVAVTAAFATVSPAPNTSAAYFTIRNAGNLPDTLVALHADRGHAELHTVVTEQGQSSMRHVERLAVAAGAEVRLAPGGYHVMLTRLPAPLAAGDTVTLTAVFARADTLTFRAPVLTYSEVVERLGAEGEFRR